MTDKSNLGRGVRFLMMAAATVILVVGLREAASILRPFLAALFLTILSLPLLSVFKRIRCPNALAVLLTMLTLVAVTVGIGALVGGSLNEFTASLPEYQQRFEQVVNGSVSWLQSKGLPAAEWISVESLQPGAVIDFVGTTVRRLALLLSNTFLVLITTFFVLAEMAGFPDKLKAAVGRDSRGPERLQKIRVEVQRYLVIKTLVSVCTGIVACLWCWVLGIDYPMLWGLIAFLLNYIPTLGSIIAGVPPTLLGVIQFGFGYGLLVALGYVAINIALGTFIEPMLMGRRLGLSTLVVFLSLVFWGWVWGPVGMLLSVPLTMILKIMLENTDDLRWIAILLDAHPPTPESVDPDGPTLPV